jgi:hypothetical protein
MPLTLRGEASTGVQARSNSPVARLSAGRRPGRSVVRSTSFGAAGVGARSLRDQARRLASCSSLRRKSRASGGFGRRPDGGRTAAWRNVARSRPTDAPLNSTGWPSTAKGSSGDEGSPASCRSMTTSIARCSSSLATGTARGPSQVDGGERNGPALSFGAGQGGRLRSPG